MEHMETSTELGDSVKECVFFSKMKKKYTDLFLPPPGLIAPKKKAPDYPPKCDICTNKCLTCVHISQVEGWL